MKVKNECIELIENLSNAKGAPGFEDEVLVVAREAMKDYARIEEDKMRNIYFYRNQNTGDKPVVMLDAHSDEVAFMVQAIKPDGTLRVLNLGRWTWNTLPSAKMKVRNADGEWISAIFVNRPGHFRSKSDSDASMDVSDLTLDVGARSLEEAKNVFKIRIGEPIVPATIFEYDEKNDLLFGKAFDCRIGCAAVLETMKRLAKEDLDVDIVGVFSVQEELGERGCKVSVNHVKPDVALCYEGCPADDTFSESYMVQTALKKGPMFRHMDVSVICSPRLQRFCLDVAEKNHMLVQESVRAGGGNDAAVTSLAQGGIPSICVGIPVRYIHSMNCLSSYLDFESTVELMVKIVKSLNKEVIDRF